MEGLEINELIKLWTSRIGKFAKLKCKTDDGQVFLKFGIVKDVIDLKLILSNPETKEEIDLPILWIMDARISDYVSQKNSENSIKIHDKLGSLGNNNKRGAEYGTTY